MSYETQMAALATMSNRYGADPAFVLAGGGNTSFKNAENLYIKGSGTSLATIRGEDFVVMDRQKLAKMWTAAYPEEEKAREAAVLQDMMDARIPGETRRPSVETLLHDLFPYSFILHVHPALVNGLTCSVEAKAAMDRLLPDAVWVDACKPGYILALECKRLLDAYKAETGKDAQVLFLQNHGIFFAANTTEELDVLAAHVMGTLAGVIRREPDLQAIPVEAKAVAEVAQTLSDLTGGVVTFMANREILAYDPATKSLSPDHIVYAKAKQLALPAGGDLKAAFTAFEAENGYQPKIVFAEGLGMFACSDNLKNANTALTVMLDAIKVVAYTESFGGVLPMPDFLIDFIVNWEVESYRSKVSQ